MLKSGCLSLNFFNINPSSLDVFSSLKNTLIFEDSPTTLAILQNNANIIIFLISGSFLAGLTTFTSLIFNGYFFGLFLMGCIRSGMQITTILALTLPHVIFELPAIWIAGTAGFKVPYESIRYFMDGKEHILDLLLNKAKYVLYISFLNKYPNHRSILIYLILQHVY
jgi:uncharacterized membrane protein SpoIIM required for sporulation